MTKYEVLKGYFGYDSFRAVQGEIIDALLAGQDVLTVMPTGAGKSLCFQVPAMLMNGLTIVISPLIALMRDQVGALVQNGVPAAFVNSSQSADESYDILANAKRGAYKLLYVAPERLDAPSFLSLAHEARISMIAVDEAHCLSLWGQDFRPSYLNIESFIQKLPRRPIVSAFTATATELVKEDIVRLLGLRSPLVRTSGFDRPNLRFEVRQPQDKDAELLKYLQANQDSSGIIYCSTRKKVEEIAAMLQREGLRAEAYHAGLSQAARSRAQDGFVYDKVPIIVATNAFGMGIDKSNVSFVVHYNMPKNMEGYYQEAGRAGRDGSPAECLLLFSPQDVMIQQRLIAYGTAAEGQVSPEEAAVIQSREYLRLRKMEAYCHTRSCLRGFILKYFEDDPGTHCNNCSNCSDDGPDRVDITIDAQKILSCVYRMRGRFGLTLLVQTLHGDTNINIRKHNLQNIKTHGQMSGRAPDEIMSIARFLLEHGYLQLHGSQYQLVDLQPRAKDILVGKETLSMPRYIPKQALKTTKQEPRLRSLGYVPRHTNTSGAKKPTSSRNELFDRLKALRLRLATEEGVPAYVIFSDATLRDMCAKHPRDYEGLLSVSGVGRVKLDKYGKYFIEILRNA